MDSDSDFSGHIGSDDDYNSLSSGGYRAGRFDERILFSDSDIDSEEDDSDGLPSDLPSAEEQFNNALQLVRDNFPLATRLKVSGHNDFVQNITNGQWEEIGRDISNNTHLEELTLDDALDDDKMYFFCRSLTSSSSIKELALENNGLSPAGLRCLEPFLQNANNLRQLVLWGNNNMQSEGFNSLLRALGDSPIEELVCVSCDIESIEIDLDYFPKHLKQLHLGENSINADGCRGLATLLQGRTSILLTHLHLDENKIDDEGVAILVDALRTNKSLQFLNLWKNDDISRQGRRMLMKLVNDISSVKAALQSNHTLRSIVVGGPPAMEYSDEDDEIHIQMQTATAINLENESNPEAAGREKIIRTQLRSVNRAVLAGLQGVNYSLYSEIDPLHLPEVLSLVGRRHGQKELYVALKSSITEVISTLDRLKCLRQERDYRAAMLEKLNAEIAAIELAAQSS